MVATSDLMGLFGTRPFLEVRNEFRAALQAGAREVRFREDDYSDVIRLLAAASNGVPVFLDEERLPGLRKGSLRMNLEWCRLFVEANGTAFPGVMIVRENGTAMFVRLLPGVPVQVTLDVTELGAFNEAGDALRGMWAVQLDHMAASVLLNPWTVTRPLTDPAQVDFHAAHRTPPAMGAGRLEEIGAPSADLLMRPVRVTVAAPDPVDTKRACEALMGVVDSYNCSKPSYGHLYGLLEEAGRTGIGDAVFERVLDSFPLSGQDTFGEIIDGLIDEGYEWAGFLPRPDPDWTYREDYVVKWAGGETGINLQIAKYQRLLRAWAFMVRAMGKLLGLNGWAFTPGLLVGDEDYLAEISEWGGRTFVLLNPQGLRVSAANSEMVLMLRDRAAHVVAHVGQPNHDESWARRYEFLLEESASLLSKWGREELSWLNSYGSSMATKKGVQR